MRYCLALGLLALAASCDSYVGSPTYGTAGGGSVATKLGFVTQPAGAAVNATITPSIQVAVQNASGGTVSTSTANVTISITPGTGNAGASLNGTTTRAAINGVATFNDISVNQIGTNYTLTATAIGLSNATSGSFTITP